MVTPSITSISEWILDSECSYHMCPDKSLFYTFKELQGGKVFMGSDHTCQTMGIRTIKLKMHNRVVCTLGEVRYVPDLKKNLISLVP